MTDYQTIINKDHLENLKTKAAKFDAINSIVSKFYIGEDGESIEDSEESGGLMEIGEKVAAYLGYL